jgi:8-oxo-dGTP diphosphatase
VTIVRHADAGSRSRFAGPDADRPITRRGRAQAAAIADLLESSGAVAIVSSPALRCVETLAPLAERLGLDIEQNGALSEESSAADALEELIDRGADVGGLVIGSSHGPIFEELLATVGAGVHSAGPPSVAKGGRVELLLDGGRITDLQTFGAPKVKS